MSKTIITIILITNIVNCSTPPSKTKTKPYPISKNPSQTKQLPTNVYISTPEEIDQIWHNKNFILVFSSAYCDASEPFWKDIYSYKHALPIHIIHETVQNEQIGERLDKIYNITHHTSPSIFMIKKGQVVDVSRRAMYYGGLDLFTTRNLSPYTPTNPTASPGKTPEARLKAALIQKELSYLNLQGVNLEGIILKKKNFEGSDLRNATFERGTLQGINFSHADLQGARLPPSTNISDIFWGSCRCPDGTLSKEHGLTCQYNLTPKRVDDIPTDPPPSQTPTDVRHRALINALD